ncbi:MAG: DinB family protein [Saprospiraceae bacterium]|nr:DinB family protein [Saprospiraceae bacterium]
MNATLLFSTFDCRNYKDMTGQAKQIQHQFEILEQKKKALMELITPLTLEKYHQQPSTGKWSVAQTANHIFLSEQLSTAYIQKKLSYPDTLLPFQLKSWGGVFLIKLALWSSYKRKAPAAINMWQQQTIFSKEDIEKHWRTLRADMINLIEKHQPAFGSHMVYRHPFAGRMTMHQMLIFFNDHMAHHLKQINRIVTKIN